MRKKIVVPKQKYTTEQLITMFNKRYPVGSKVRWRAKASDTEYELLTVLTQAYDRYGQPVVQFEERSGCCSIMEQFVDYADGIE